MQNAGYFTTQLIAAGVTDFDIIGVSHYSQWSTINDMAGIKNNIAALKAGTGKNVIIVETAYPFTIAGADNYTNTNSATAMVSGYAITQDGQYQYMKDLTQAVISGGGKGVMYWAPDWISCSYGDQWGTGSSWENNALFDFSGNAIPAINYMNHIYQF